MIGSLLTRSLALVLGYAYPAYECFKVVELNRPEIDQLRFWCKYWILVAILTVLERVGDTFISWLPMYSEAKVAFFVYLWYPKTRGATYVYETFLQPYIASHENEIDRNLLELKTRAGDFAVLYWQKVANYGQARVYEVLRYAASQAPSQQSRPRTTTQRPPAHQSRHTPTSEPPALPAAPAVAATAAAQTQQPNPPPSSPIKMANQEPIKTGTGPSKVPTPSHTQSSSVNTPQPTASETNSKPTISGEVNQIPASAASAASTAADARPEETQMEEAIRMTRGRLRRNAAPLSTR